MQLLQASYSHLNIPAQKVNWFTCEKLFTSVARCARVSQYIGLELWGAQIEMCFIF
jgi:hypothetical protein